MYNVNFDEYVYGEVVDFLKANHLNACEEHLTKIVEDVKFEWNEIGDVEANMQEVIEHIVNVELIKLSL
tara:strand:- start:110 stop:316 length:207 start_codon:yes stop_codon:yes gene_type:complete